MKKSKNTTINVYLYLGIVTLPCLFLWSLLIYKAVKINDILLNISYGIISSTQVVFLLDLYNNKKSKVESEKKEQIILEELSANLNKFKRNLSKHGADILNDQEINYDLFGWLNIVFSEENYDDGFEGEYAKNIMYEIVESINEIKNSLVDLKRKKNLLVYTGLYSTNFSDLINNSIAICNRLMRNIEGDKISLTLIQNQIKYLMNEIEEVLHIKLGWKKVVFNYKNTK